MPPPLFVVLLITQFNNNYDCNYNIKLFDYFYIIYLCSLKWGNIFVIYLICCILYHINFFNCYWQNNMWLYSLLQFCPEPCATVNCIFLIFSQKLHFRNFGFPQLFRHIICFLCEKSGTLSRKLTKDSWSHMFLS